MLAGATIPTSFLAAGHTSVATLGASTAAAHSNSVGAVAGVAGVRREVRDRFIQRQVERSATAEESPVSKREDTWSRDAFEQRLDARQRGPAGYARFARGRKAYRAAMPEAAHQ